MFSRRTFDDAVLSMGQVLAGRPDAIVATLFTGTPVDESTRTSYDRDCGFGSAGHAMRARVAEDRAAMGLLSARSVHLGFLDHQYRGDTAIDEDHASGVLADLVADQGISTVVGPLGLAHPDHVVTARVMAGLLAFPSMRSVDAWLYEDLPSRVLWPETVGPRAAEWWASGWKMSMLDFFGTGPLDVKADAVGCYRSQLWALNMHAVLCPERLWHLHRRTE